MNGDKEWVIFAEYRAEVRSDALWKKYGDAGSYPNELDMGDGVKSRKNFFESGVGKKKSVSSGYENVADFGGVFQILKSSFPLCF